MTNTHAFFAGSVTAFNIRRHLTNLGKALSDEFDLHLVTTKINQLRTEVGKYYQLHGHPESNSRLSEVRVLKDYLLKHSPDSLTQITQPPIHGTLCGSLSNILSDVDFVYRYSGDSFMLYKFYDSHAKYRNYILYNVIGQFPLYQAKECIVLGRHGREQLTKRGVSPEQIVCLPPMIDPERFRETKPIQFDNNRTIFGFVGRVSRLKGAETLEKTIPEIIERRPDCKFVFVGGINDDRLKEQFPNHVEIVGPVLPGQVPAYMKGFDTLVHPSLTEGIPRAVLEALYVSTPVIARDVGDLDEVTDNLFKKNTEFVQMVCDCESLPLDDISDFMVDRASRKYAQFYNFLSE
jgi:glycosyltransferase involved in cell wall biosynthesis